MTNSILRRLAVGGVAVSIALAALLPGRVVLAATKTTYVKKCTSHWTYRIVNKKKKWTKKWTCRYVKKVVPVATKTVNAYKPGYNLMTSTGSSKGSKPAGVTAICADGHYVSGTVTTASCAAHHGIACRFRGNDCSTP